VRSKKDDKNDYNFKDLKKHRKKKGYSSRTMAVLTDVSFKYYSDMERGRKPLNKKTLSIIRGTYPLEPSPRSHESDSKRRPYYPLNRGNRKSHVTAFILQKKRIFGVENKQVTRTKKGGQ